MSPEGANVVVARATQFAIVHDGVEVVAAEGRYLVASLLVLGCRERQRYTDRADVLDEK